MIEKESEWILPKNLKKQEEKERKLVDIGLFDGKGDFGSYYALSKYNNKNYIEAHAINKDEDAYSYIENLIKALKQNKLELKGNIIDIGCSIGTITNAIGSKNYFGRTFGLDISEDAIMVAKNNYPNLNFICKSADDLSNFEDGYFDIIHAKEFYPFTRTNDIEYHKEYLALFSSKLKKSGFAVLEMSNTKKGFCNTYQEISKDIKNIGYSKLIRFPIIGNKLAKHTGNLTYGILYKPLFFISNRILKRKPRYLYIIKK